MSLIVSLTSTSYRLDILKYTLLSLLDQHHSPEKIVLNISKEPYLIDEGISELPSWLKKMENENSVEIVWVKNTGSYRKLLPVYRSASANDMIVTCDDDVIYGPKWLQALVDCAHENKNAIVCGRARKPAKTPWGSFQSYLNWSLAEPGSEGYELVPTGISGVLYRKALLDKAVMSSDHYLELAPKQDDLWFHLARQKMGSKVVVSVEAGQHAYPIEAPGALSISNAATQLSGWDRVVRAFLDRILMRIKAGLGVPVCDNDIVFKKLNAYSGFEKK